MSQPGTHAIWPTDTWGPPLENVYGRSAFRRIDTMTCENPKYSLSESRRQITVLLSSGLILTDSLTKLSSMGNSSIVSESKYFALRISL